MRTLSFLAASLLAIGGYLVVATVLALSMAWIGTGTIFIAAVAAIALVAVEAGWRPMPRGA